MKEIKNLQKQISLMGKEINLNVWDMLEMAVSTAEINLKGLSRISMALKLLEKIQAAKKNQKGNLLLEDAEFEILYESVDKMAWGPAAMHFPEFFNEIIAAKERK